MVPSCQEYVTEWMGGGVKISNNIILKFQVLIINER